MNFQPWLLTQDMRAPRRTHRACTDLWPGLRHAVTLPSYLISAVSGEIPYRRHGRARGRRLGTRRNSAYKGSAPL